MMVECDVCLRELPESKFNFESFSPETCFHCRTRGMSFTFAGGRGSFHGDSLVGGTIASDNRHTVSEARSMGHDPVPVKNGESSWAPSAKQVARLKKASTPKATKLAL